MVHTILGTAGGLFLCWFILQVLFTDLMSLWLWLKMGTIFLMGGMLVLGLVASAIYLLISAQHAGLHPFLSLPVITLAGLVVTAHVKGYVK